MIHTINKTRFAVMHLESGNWIYAFSHSLFGNLHLRMRGYVKVNSLAWNCHWYKKLLNVSEGTEDAN